MRCVAYASRIYGLQNDGSEMFTQDEYITELETARENGVSLDVIARSTGLSEEDYFAYSGGELQIQSEMW